MKTGVWLTVSIEVLCAVAAPFTGIGIQQTVPGNNFGVAGRNITYDFIVVGGGTGGLTIAYRLAEDGTKTVAVVEAGGFYEVENGNTSVVPAYNQEYNYVTPDSQWYTPLVDWGFLTTPQAGAKGQIYHYGRGKMLGGCSAENAMNYHLPPVGVMQDWANAVNDSSYAWSSFLPYYRRSINYTEPNTALRASNATVPPLSLNGTGGPLQVSHPNWAAPFSSWAKLAFQEIGIGEVHDLMSGQLIGAQYSPLSENPSDQTRSSSQTSFLDRAMNNGMTNLKVYTHSLAKRIVFDGNKTARSVLVQSGPSPQLYELTARQEIIVSAGAFQSPQLLMVSGVGPSQTLTSHGVPIVANRPGVGQNMWDHAVLSVARQLGVATYGQLMNQTLARAAESDYGNHTGILTNDMSDFLGWEKLPRGNLSQSAINDLSRFASDWPEIEYEISSASFGAPVFTTPEKPIDVGYLQPVLIAPLSRGNLSISSSDMSDPPIINPNWLTHPTDQEVAIAAFKRGRQFFNTSAIAPILIGDELLPGRDLPVNSSDAEILSYLQTNIGFNWHASCTCKMGPQSDPMAVVDSKARVFGVNRLRVVDASAFPFLPPGHPQAVVYALAEKIAADIMSGQ